jgi:UDP-3-O-[3-hydroxymyristoyl] N-acetylglucosamine deacetylase / 3-hydroxyacyl-[acyl-carrier-protein] dehydratase
MVNQQTLRETVRFSGVGLHSGNPVNMAFLPAPPHTGIRFRRIDLDGKPEIEARIDNVSDTTRSTTLSKGNVKIHTVEHVLAAFNGLEIDNAVVELDANEPPITDGSAREYARLIQSAGIVPQSEPREVFKVTSPFELQVGETTLSVFPHERLKISCVSADKRGRFTQQYSLEVTPDSWEREIAHARTFCFFEEIEALIKNGLIKGGSLENAVVIRDDAVLTTEPLRYPEEFVRHKILDIIGDLALLGKQVCAHITAMKPSHTANCELTRQLLIQMRKPLVAAQTFAPPPPPPAPSAAPAPAKTAPGKESTPVSQDIVVVRDGMTLNINQLKKILPHRYPFLMVDKVVHIEGNKITAIKNVTVNEPFFQGHFPGYPIMPGVLQLEAMAQVAGLLMMRQAENAGKLAYFMSAENVKWRRPVVPGDTLVIDIEMTKSRGKIGRAKCACKVDGEVVSEAEVTFMLGDAL